MTWRLAVEHPERVTRAAVLDIVPLRHFLREEVPDETLAALLSFFA